MRAVLAAIFMTLLSTQTMATGAVAIFTVSGAGSTIASDYISFNMLDRESAKSAALARCQRAAPSGVNCLLVAIFEDICASFASSGARERPFRWTVGFGPTIQIAMTNAVDACAGFGFTCISTANSPCDGSPGGRSQSQQVAEKQVFVDRPVYVDRIVEKPVDRVVTKENYIYTDRPIPDSMIATSIGLVAAFFGWLGLRLRGPAQFEPAAPKSSSTIEDIAAEIRGAAPAEAKPAAQPPPRKPAAAPPPPPPPPPPPDPYDGKSKADFLKDRIAAMSRKS